jgi:hypothetical protein
MDTVCFGLLWTDGRNDAAIRDLAIVGDLVYVDEETSVGARGHACANSLGESSQFVGKRRHPGGLVGPFHQVTVEGLVTELACCGVGKRAALAE